MSCAVGCRSSLDPTLLWLWYRLGAIALIGPLAWELPNAKGMGHKNNKKKKKKKKKRERERQRPDQAGAPSEKLA